MIGMNSKTGKHIAGYEHLRQSVFDILMTPVGTRMVRRDYGSRVFEHLDKPFTASTLADIYTAIADALLTWEPRINVTRIMASQAETSGKVTVDIIASYKRDTILIDGVILE